MISISIVSHNQGDLVKLVLDDLAKIFESTKFEVILICNLPEVLPFSIKDYTFPLKIFINEQIIGFGSNHNKAFSFSSGNWFCVVNPDIRLFSDPFPKLLELMTIENVAVAAPLIIAQNGNVEDSARIFPTPFNLLAKLFGFHDGRYSITVDFEVFQADWVGGMFMFFRSADFKLVGGFDQSYFLYYEDVDICARLWQSGKTILVNPRVSVIHDARRSSRRRLRYIIWHLTSMGRYLFKHWLRLPNILRVNVK